jgi:hypothetical protein
MLTAAYYLDDVQVISRHACRPNLLGRQLDLAGYGCALLRDKHDWGSIAAAHHRDLVGHVLRGIAKNSIGRAMGRLLSTKPQ